MERENNGIEKILNFRISAWDLGSCAAGKFKFIRGSTRNVFLIKFQSFGIK